jgi:dolichol-phosphate mannosyltransferase
MEQNRTTRPRAHLSPDAPDAPRTSAPYAPHAPSAPPAPVLSVIVPTYNERTRIAELVRAVFAVFERSGLDGELVVVDDNSPDGTGAIVDDLARQIGPRLVPVHRAGKLGLGTAVMEGFNRASAAIVGVMDADFSHPPDGLPALYAVLVQTGSDAAVGSRYIPGGRVENWPFGRRLMSKLACVMAWPLTPVRDATSGFFLIRREVVQGVQIAAGGFKICLELLLRSPVRSVAEVPYVFVDRTIGQSKMSTREAMGYITQLRQLYAVRFLGPRRPRLKYERSRRAVERRDA